MALQRVKPNTSDRLDPEWIKLIAARHADPFSVLGRHPNKKGERILVYLPHARGVRIEGGPVLARVDGTDLFSCEPCGNEIARHYRLEWIDQDGSERREYDPYTFPPQIPDYDLHLFGEGRHWHAYRFLGAQLWECDGVQGVRFAIWAPNAERISVVGDFNAWDGRRHPMGSRGGSGVWELFIPELRPGTLYKFEIRGQGGAIQLKADPYGRRFEMRPSTASIVVPGDAYPWQDGDWMRDREALDWLHAPLSVYEVHLGSWRRHPDGGFANYRELAEQLVEYVTAMGFTHIELLPITEHPLDASWGYQTIGHFAPTSRHGSPDDFRYLVDYCHRRGIGVLMDWVPAHFPKDPHGLAWFDGTALYEHADPRRGEHRDWGTLIFNYGRNEVKNLLLASAVYWLEEFHIDGLRVDAVASMLYLDYSREPGDWVPNIYGGRENLEAIDFLRELNGVIQGQFKGAMMIAEESTDWPQVTRPSWVGGLGFSMKWNMGWMHDTLQYMQQDPIYRHYHHDKLTFGLVYAYSENFMLPFSHDEVVHMKGSLVNKMAGDEWQRFANLRLLYTYMLTYPGKKLLFMGCEFGQRKEWDHDRALDWELLEQEPHRGVRMVVRDLNRLYCDMPALHRLDFDPGGFAWIDCHDASQSVLSYLRKSDGATLIVALNFTPVPRRAYRIGAPEPGRYLELFNSDSAHYGGSNVGNAGALEAQDLPWMGQPFSLVLTLPPLGGLILCEQGAGQSGD